MTQFLGRARHRRRGEGEPGYHNGYGKPRQVTTRARSAERGVVCRSGRSRITPAPVRPRAGSPGPASARSSAKGLVEARRCHIRAESAGAGQGTTFSFTLPVAGEAGESATHAAPARPARRGGLPPILMMDDDRQNVTLSPRHARGAGLRPGGDRRAREAATRKRRRSRALQGTCASAGAVCRRRCAGRVRRRRRGTTSGIRPLRPRRAGLAGRGRRHGWRP